MRHINKVMWEEKGGGGGGGKGERGGGMRKEADLKLARPSYFIVKVLHTHRELIGAPKNTGNVLDNWFGSDKQHSNNL